MSQSPMPSAATKRSTRDLLEESEQQQRPAKRVRKDAAKPKHSSIRNENIVASIEVQGENQRREANRSDRETADCQPSKSSQHALDTNSI